MFREMSFQLQVSRLEISSLCLTKSLSVGRKYNNLTEKIIKVKNCHIVKGDGHELYFFSISHGQLVGAQ